MGNETWGKGKGHDILWFRDFALGLSVYRMGEESNYPRDEKQHPWCCHSSFKKNMGTCHAPGPRRCDAFSPREPKQSGHQHAESRYDRASRCHVWTLEPGSLGWQSQV